MDERHVESAFELRRFLLEGRQPSGIGQTGGALKLRENGDEFIALAVHLGLLLEVACRLAQNQASYVARLPGLACQIQILA